MRKLSDKLLIALDHLSFLWISCFAFFTIMDKLTWHVPQAILCSLVGVLFVFSLIRNGFGSKNLYPLSIAGLALSSLWYEMALSSLQDDTGPMLLFILPVLIVWSARNIVQLEKKITLFSFAWLIPLIAGMSIFLPMDPVREYWANSLDPETPRHSLRAGIAALTILASTLTLFMNRVSSSTSSNQPQGALRDPEL